MSGRGEKPEFPPDRTVEEAAAEWLVRHDRGLTPAQQDAFLQWIASSPVHRESFDRHRRMWGDFNALAQWRPEHSAEPNPDLLARPRRSRLLRWSAPVALAAAAAVAVAWIAPGSFGLGGARPVALETDSYRQETLPDGTVIDLNGGAHVMVQFSRTERRVRLAEGEAQFSVANDPQRPFVVRAAGVDVRAVGTAFNVKLAGASLEVLVTEGTVHVAQTPAAASAPPASTAPATVPVLAELTAGHRTVIAVAPVIAAPTVIPATDAEIERMLEWKPRLLDFDSTPLDEVIAVFNRRNVRQLRLADESLRSLPIVASIRSDNLDGFIRLLEATMNVRAERQPDGSVVLFAR